MPWDHLLSAVWGEGYWGKKHLLHVNINRLRGKLETTPANPDAILTKKGVGYFFATWMKGTDTFLSIESVSCA